MKRIIILAILALLIRSAFAGHDQSILNLRLSNNAPFKVLIDGQQVGGIGNSATIPYLHDGKHFVEVFAVNNFRKFHSTEKVFCGEIHIKKNTESFATIYPECHKLEFDRVLAFKQHDWHERDYRESRYYPKNHDKIVPVVCESRPVPGPVAMCQADFLQLKLTISDAGFENTRMNIFKQALPYNFFTTAQVRVLMDLFWFEGSKLEVAKLAYPKTLDQNNYYVINNGFAFSSSMDELNDYMAMR